MIAAVTGHRPDKLGGYWPHTKLQVWVRDQLQAALMMLKPESAISGMALGVDQYFARICVDLGIPFEAAVPFAGQASLWPEHAQQAYLELLGKAASVNYICPPGYAAWKMQRRNEWMVDHCDVLIAVWDGSPGGTMNCLAYAEKVGRRIHRINPNDFKVGG